MHLKQLVIVFSLLLSSVVWAGSDFSGSGGVRDLGGLKPIGTISAEKPIQIKLPPLFPLPQPKNPYKNFGGVTVGGGLGPVKSCYDFLYDHVKPSIGAADRDGVAQQQEEIAYNLLSTLLLLAEREDVGPLLPHEQQAGEIVGGVLDSMPDSMDFLEHCLPSEKISSEVQILKSHVEYLQQGSDYLTATSALIQ